MNKLIHIPNYSEIKKVKNILESEGIKFEEYYAYEAMIKEEAEIRIENLLNVNKLDEETYKNLINTITDNYLEEDSLIDDTLAEEIALEAIHEILNNDESDINLL